MSLIEDFLNRNRPDPVSPERLRAATELPTSQSGNEVEQAVTDARNAERLATTAPARSELASRLGTANPEALRTGAPDTTAMGQRLAQGAEQAAAQQAAAPLRNQGDPRAALQQRLTQGQSASRALAPGEAIPSSVPNPAVTPLDPAATPARPVTPESLGFREVPTPARAPITVNSAGVATPPQLTAEALRQTPTNRAALADAVRARAGFSDVAGGPPVPGATPPGGWSDVGGDRPGMPAGGWSDAGPRAPGAFSDAGALPQGAASAPSAANPGLAARMRAALGLGPAAGGPAAAPGAPPGVVTPPAPGGIAGVARSAMNAGARVFNKVAPPLAVAGGIGEMVTGEDPGHVALGTLDATAGAALMTPNPAAKGIGGAWLTGRAIGEGAKAGYAALPQRFKDNISNSVNSAAHLVGMGWEDDAWRRMNGQMPLYQNSDGTPILSEDEADRAQLIAQAKRNPASQTPAQSPTTPESGVPQDVPMLRQQAARELEQRAAQQATPAPAPGEALAEQARKALAQLDAQQAADAHGVASRSTEWGAGADGVSTGVRHAYKMADGRVLQPGQALSAADAAALARFDERATMRDFLQQQLEAQQSAAPAAPPAASSAPAQPAPGSGSRYAAANGHVPFANVADAATRRNFQIFAHAVSGAEGADYNTLVGGKTIADLSKHPGMVGVTTKDGPSTAAGRYQITGTTWKDIAAKNKLTDFSPASQDRAFLALLARRGALDDVAAGNFDAAVGKLGDEWQGLPSGTSKNQGKRTPEQFRQLLAQAGAQLDGTPAPAADQAPAAGQPASAAAASDPLGNATQITRMTASGPVSTMAVPAQNGMVEIHQAAYDAYRNALQAQPEQSGRVAMTAAGPLVNGVAVPPAVLGAGGGKIDEYLKQAQEGAQFGANPTAAKIAEERAKEIAHRTPVPGEIVKVPMEVGHNFMGEPMFRDDAYVRGENIKELTPVVPSRAAGQKLPEDITPTQARQNAIAIAKKDRSKLNDVNATLHKFGMPELTPNELK